MWSTFLKREKAPGLKKKGRWKGDVLWVSGKFFETENAASSQFRVCRHLCAYKGEYIYALAFACLCSMCRCMVASPPVTTHVNCLLSPTVNFNVKERKTKVNLNRKCYYSVIKVSLVWVDQSKASETCWSDGKITLILNRPFIYGASGVL